MFPDEIADYILVATSCK